MYLLRCFFRTDDCFWSLCVSVWLALTWHLKLNTLRDFTTTSCRAPRCVTAVRYACGLHLYVYRHGLLSIESSEVELDIGISGGGKAELYWNGLKS